jgi:carboxymethylenebutenolidase
MARLFAHHGYVALAVDLYGESADSPERARELMGNVDEAQAEENLRQAYRYLAEQHNAPRVGVVGWCFGGGWSLRTALALPGQIDAAVIYYGRLIQERDRLAMLDMPILGIFGAEDEGIPVDGVRQFESTLEELGKDVDIQVYEGAGHAFANPSGERYQPEAARDAWQRTLDFLERTLKR